MGFKKGHKRFGGAVKGQKYAKTLEKEARRALFDAKVEKKWGGIVGSLIIKNKPYVADQYMGKAPEVLEIGPSRIKLNIINEKSGNDGNNSQTPSETE